MESALGWIGRIADFLGNFIPRLRVVRTTYGAVKWVRGSKVKRVGPGLTVYWPLVTDFVEWPVARQAVQLREQTIVTLDDKTIVVGGVLVYSVEDIVKLVAQTYWPDETVKDIALTAVHDVCCQGSWDELKDGQRRGTLDTQLKNAAQKVLSDYGVKVMKLMLTDLAPGRVLRLVQSSSSDVQPRTSDAVYRS